MNNATFSLTVNTDGTLTVPAMLMAGMKLLPGQRLELCAPYAAPLCEDCDSRQLFLARTCPLDECIGYRSDSDTLCLPPQLLRDAEIPLGADLEIITHPGLVIIVDADCLEDFIE